MPTVFTHALVGASITSLRQRSVPPFKFFLVAAILAVIPDIDVVGFRLGIPYSDDFGHRGFTHSLVFSALLAVIVALTLFREIERFSGPFYFLVGLLFVASASHGVLDAFTNAGLGVGFFIPFDDTRYFAPWRPLTASPLSVSRFFSGQGQSILLNELRYVGPPALAFICIAIISRRIFAKRRG